MCRFRRVREGRRRCPHGVLRLAGPAASRAGKRGHRRRRWRDHHGCKGSRARDAGVRRIDPRRSRRVRGRGACPLFDKRGSGLVGSRAAAHFRHRRRAHRACPQRHARQHQRHPHEPHKRGRAIPLAYRQRGGREGHRLRHPADPSPEKRHPPCDGNARGRLRYGARKPRFALCVSRPERHPAAVRREASRRSRVGCVKRNLRP